MDQPPAEGRASDTPAASGISSAPTSTPQSLPSPNVNVTGGSSGNGGNGGSGGGGTVSGGLGPATPTPPPTSSTSSPAPSVTQGSTTTSTPSGPPSFRRQRASRACETCHARKVRCDAASLGVPCTNCVAFSIECKIPVPKRNKKAIEIKKKEELDGRSEASPSVASPSPGPPSLVTKSTDGLQEQQVASQSNSQLFGVWADYGRTRQFSKTKITRAPIKEAGRVAFLGESSNFSLLVRDQNDEGDVVHYPLPQDIRGARARMTDLDALELDILKLRGAFLLPPRALCDELVEAFFTWVAPIVPVVNRSRFMRQYRDPNNPPSLLLLQAMLLAGSRVCYNPQLMDASGSTTPAAMTFYKRAKALYDANYEDDRVTIVQSLILMGWYWEGPEDVTKNVFYWSRVATIVAQGSGMHRSVEHSQLSEADKRLWKRIWWTLFTRDRSVAVALGRPSHINTDDSDVKMLTEEDFLEDEPGYPAEYPPNPLHVQFFLQYVKLCEIMGLVLAQQYSVASKYRRQKNFDLQQSDLALVDWMKHVPDNMRYHVEDKSRQNFWAALLHMNYYTTLCLLHRAQMVNPQISNGNYPVEGSAESRNIAFRAAAAISSIIENINRANELRYCPAFVVYSLFSALIMHVYQTRSTNAQVIADAQRRIKICMDALRDTSKVWIVAKMVSTLFESIIGNKEREERLKTSIRRQQRAQTKAAMQAQSDRLTEPIKRKFDEMDITSVNTTTGPPVSFERSRPQTPAPGASPMHSNTTPGRIQQMDYLSKPINPFAPAHSMPGSPPADLFLVTRSSPNLNQNWENFQPHQLFPEDSGMSMNAPTNYAMGDASLSPQTIHQQLSSYMGQQHQGLRPPGSMHGRSSSTPIITKTTADRVLEAYDPNTGYPSHPHPPPHPHPHSHASMNILPTGYSLGSQQGQQQQASGSPLMQGQSQSAAQQQGTPYPWSGANGFADIDPMTGSSPEDSWSTSSQQGLNVPAGLNVEDWFQFFGLTGEMAGLMDSHMSDAP